MIMNISYQCASPAKTAIGPSPGRKESAIRRRLQSLFTLFNLWHDRVRQRRALAALDNRSLSDVGLDRHQVLAEIEKPFWQA